VSPTPHETKTDARNGLNFDLPENDFKNVQGAGFTLARPMQFSFKRGSKIVSINLPYEDIKQPQIKSLREEGHGTGLPKRVVAELLAKRLAERKYESDFGMRDKNNETVLVRHDKDSVTYEIIWQPPEDTHTVEVNL
jgi:hypothetical protein